MRDLSLLTEVELREREVQPLSGMETQVELMGAFFNGRRVPRATVDPSAKVVETWWPVTALASAGIDCGRALARAAKKARKSILRVIMSRDVFRV
jgi:hypothetical protein